MQNSSTVFLDYASTTPVNPSVVEVMLPFFNQNYGNPSSIHKLGQYAEHAMEKSRHTMAKIIGAADNEIIFTSCGSESDNLALRGVALAQKQQNSASHILISAVEHHAVSNTARQLGDFYGFEIEIIPVDEFGMVDPQEVKKRIRDETALVSIIFANNEIGSINPIQEIGEICHVRGVPFHTDAVQAAAHLPIDVNELKVDLLSIGAHKFYGPKGVGALYIRENTPILATQTGGGQEFNLRAGTSNVPLIVGMEKAFDLAQTEHGQRTNHYAGMRDLLISSIMDTIPLAKITGHPIQRLPNHASFAFKDVDGNTLLMILDSHGFACSSGSACKTGSPEPSDVLLSMGLTPDWALGSLRVTLGQYSTFEEIENFLAILPGAITRVRELG